MKKFETIQSPHDEDGIGKAGSGKKEPEEITNAVKSIESRVESEAEPVEYSASIESIEDIVASKTEVDSPEEREGMMYVFDIRHKHPQSKIYYDGQLDSDIRESRNTQINVFAELDGKDLVIDGKSVGKFTVTPDLVPQCTYKPQRAEDGKYDLAGDCGWFFKIKIRVNAKEVDLAEVVSSILAAIGDISKVDYMVIEKGISLKTPLADGYSLKRSITVDVSGLKSE